MAKLNLGASLAILLIFISLGEAATPLFLQAITSALATIPFSGGPITTGIVGAKLAVGTKLLYYLGYFGKNAKPVTPKVTAQKFPSSLGGKSSLSGQLQPLPLPYMFSGGGFPASSNFQPVNFPAASGFSQASMGINPAQLFQILTESGVDPNLVMEALSSAGGMNVANSGFETSGMKSEFVGDSNAGFGSNLGFGGGSTAGFDPNAGFGASSNPSFAGLNQGSSNIATGQMLTRPDQEGNTGTFSQTSNVQSSQNQATSGGSEDVESFFTFLRDMDENSCISRLVCDIGNDPSFLGDFSENIYSMVGSLNVQPSSRAFQYIDIMEKGKHGQCREKFPQCTDMAYEIVKNVAPSVGIPQNVDPAVVNQL